VNDRYSLEAAVAFIRGERLEGRTESVAGGFGPVASKKLAEDFALWDERARTFDDEDFYDSFRLMREMFEFAAEGGACRLRCF